MSEDTRVDQQHDLAARPDGRPDIFRAAVETTRMPMVVTDANQPDNPIIYCNPAFLQMTGYSLEELRGQNCRILQGPNTDRTITLELRQAINEQRETAVEILNYRKNGSAFWNALFVSPVYSHSGELTYYFGSMLDVSRRRDAEDALRHAQKLEALGRLTGGIAHDFNNLLQIILGYIEELKSQATGAISTDSTSAVMAIEQAASRGATLVQQLLAFARRQMLDGRVINLNQLIVGLRPLIEKTLTHNLSVHYQLEEDLRNARLDSGQAELAILNLLFNARDATPNGGSIVIRTANIILHDQDAQVLQLEAGNYVALTVEDNGAGISEDHLHRVTEPFFTTKEPGRGTGLGLSMVYGFVTQSGGALQITSQPGTGTSVTLYFPIAVNEPIPMDSNDTHSPPPSQSRETILIVDDQIEIGRLAEMILADRGYQTIVVTNGPDAMNVLEGDKTIDLLLTDYLMSGGMNGEELARKALEAQPRLKILMMTGSIGYDFQTENRADRSYHTIHKPFRRTELAGTVQRLLQRHSGID